MEELIYNFISLRTLESNGEIAKLKKRYLEIK